MKAKRIVREDASMGSDKSEEESRKLSYLYSLNIALHIGELSPPAILFRTDKPAIPLADGQLPCEARSIAIWHETGYHLPKQDQ